MQQSIPSPSSVTRSAGDIGTLWMTTPPVRNPAARQGLAEFIQAHEADILADWDAYARSLGHDDMPLDPAGVRDHGPDILHNIVWTLTQPLSGSPADAAQPPHPNAAQAHADARRLQGITVDAILSEYRALRASVLTHWRNAGGGTHARDTSDLARFDEAIDQGIAEAIGRYVQQTKTATDLFIGILGHDIRNPLGTIMVSAEYLVKSRQLPATSVAPILNAAARIQGIVEQTMDFSRTQSHGAMPVRRLPGHLGDMLVKVVQETQVRHPDRIFHCDVSGDLEGNWDEHRLGQVLSNLLGNAIAYGARDSIISVKVWSTDDKTSFSVHNHGAAIPQAEQLRIFEPLVRGNAAIVERRGRAGLGLGLYICREIVRAHGGWMAVASAPNTGTTFSVHLPRRPDDAQPPA
jgi:signal transduction histidine kinase